MKQVLYITKSKFGTSFHTVKTNQLIATDIQHKSQEMKSLNINGDPVITAESINGRESIAYRAPHLITTQDTRTNIHGIARDEHGRLLFKINDKSVLTEDEIWSKKEDEINALVETLVLKHLEKIDLGDGTTTIKGDIHIEGHHTTKSSHVLNHLRVGSLTIDGEQSSEHMRMIHNYVRPINTIYTQYARGSTFNIADEPSTLFGGTWIKLFNTESVYFRTQGSMSTEKRTNGLQIDAAHEFYGTTHRIAETFAVSGCVHGINKKLPGYWGGHMTPTHGDYTNAGAYETKLSFQTRTANETRTKNRQIIIWKKTGNA